jgi:hypothetical protein
MMKTERVVRLLKDALAGKVPVALEGELDELAHYSVPVHVGDATIVF